MRKTLFSESESEREPAESESEREPEKEIPKLSRRKPVVEEET